MMSQQVDNIDEVAPIIIFSLKDKSLFPEFDSDICQYFLQFFDFSLFLCFNIFALLFLSNKYGSKALW